MRLPDSEFHVLLVLARGDAHGYRILQAVNEMKGDAPRLRPGVLYAALGRLADAGMIAEVDDRPAKELDDKRRRYYRITNPGTQALAAEVSRLAQLVRYAQDIDPSWGTT